jgi:hypothetical protein
LQPPGILWRDGVDLINNIFGCCCLPWHTSICVHRILVVVCANLCSHALCFVWQCTFDKWGYGLRCLRSVWFSGSITYHQNQLPPHGTIFDSQHMSALVATVRVVLATLLVGQFDTTTRWRWW